MLDGKCICVLGSTGSIGCSTLDVVRHYNVSERGKTSPVRVVALTAQKNVARLIEQCHEFKPEYVAIGDETFLPDLKEGVENLDISVGGGRKGIVEAALHEKAGWVMAAIVGAAGLESALAAVNRGADLALANKECLVCAGSVFMDAVKRGKGALLPVDSEHNAIFQVYDFNNPDRIRRVILTASGGPFKDTSRKNMEDVTPQEAVRHPNWSMGVKISVDSATMMNKGLELIEASWLFPETRNRMEILVHPQSVIHSMVEYVDGSVLCQMGTPDMRTPISHTLAWPDRIETSGEQMSFSDIRALTFEEPDGHRFPALLLSRAVMEKGGAFPAILNAANEVAVEAFLNAQIGFLDIVSVVETVIDHFMSRKEWDVLEGLDHVLQADRESRCFCREILKKMVFSA